MPGWSSRTPARMVLRWSPVAAATAVTITSATPGATVSYTTNGTLPTRTNGTLIASGQTGLVNGTVALKAIAFVATGTWTDSAVISGTYTVNTTASLIPP